MNNLEIYSNQSIPFVIKPKVSFVHKRGYITMNNTHITASVSCICVCMSVLVLSGLTMISKFVQV